MDAVLNWLWQGGVVAAAASVMLVALQRASARARHAVCWAALLLILALPVLPPVASTTPPIHALLPARTQAVVSLPATWWTSTVVILAAWSVWAGTQLVRFLTAIIAVRRARTRARAFPAHLESRLPHWRGVRSSGRRADLVLSNSVTSAAVLGWGAPMIAVAPSLARTLDPDDLDRVLIHEWAHVQRQDDVFNVLQIVARLIAGWHPAQWWIDRRLHVEREIACDEMTVAITGQPRSYAKCLMKLSTLTGTPRAMQSAPGIFRPSDLRARVVKIVSPHRSIGAVWSRTLAAATVLALCMVSVAVAGLTPVAATAVGQPLISARTLTFDPASYRPVPVAASAPADSKTEPRRRRASGRSSSPQRPNAERTSPPVRAAVEPTAPPASPQPVAVDSFGAADAEPEPEPTAVPDGATAPRAPQAPRVSAEPPQTLWTAAASGGAALGRKSKDAGVATAGFFTRFARRVAGS